MKTTIMIGLVALAACAKPESAQTDSAAATASGGLPPVDTLKVATDSLATRDSLPSRTPVPTKTTGTQTKTQTKTDGRLRDSVTPLDTSKPMLPPAKKRPG